MKNLKKICFLLSALTLTFTAALTTACKKEEPSSSPDYGEYIFPEDDDPITYRSVKDGDGTAFSRYECKVGYYELELPGDGVETFYSFSVMQTGMYALYTMDTISEDSGITIMRYDASIHYIPTDEDGNYIGEEADLVPEKNVLYSKVNCGEAYSEQSDLENWRATYGITSETATTLKVRFVRIGDPLKAPKEISTSIEAKELKGRILDEEHLIGKQAIPVPFGSTYFYDEDYEMTVQSLTDSSKTDKVKGFYRMGTEEKPGEVIYMAITSVPSRMFGGNTFANIQYEGDNLSLFVEENEDGDYLVNDYVDFIMNDGGVEEGEKDTDKLCYQNCVNVMTNKLNSNTQVGMYPVNQELYDFLTLYVKNNPPAMDAEDLAAYESTLWLAPCYYYAQVRFGSEAYPNNVTTGTTTVNVEAYSEVYYNVKWAATTGENGVAVTSGQFALTCDTENAVIFYNGINYRVTASEPVILTLDADSTTGATFAVKYLDDKGTVDKTDDVTSGTVSFTLTAVVS